LFEDYVLDTAWRELRRASAQLAIEPQVFDLLEFLVRSRDRVVSKDDLLASVWGGRIVSESTLASRINAARRAIGDTGEQQRLIRTVIGKGIRFVGEVREQQDAEQSCCPSPTSRMIRSWNVSPIESGAHLRAERFDTDPVDLAQTQSEMTGRLAGTINFKVVETEGFKACLKKLRREYQQQLTAFEADIDPSAWAWERVFVPLFEPPILSQSVESETARVDSTEYFSGLPVRKHANEYQPHSAAHHHLRHPGTRQILLRGGDAHFVVPWPALA
jgi:DNA-binding winged helix-turn-helix (wHTH) protein